MKLEQITILEEIKSKQNITGQQESLYPILCIYNSAPAYARINEVRDYLWHDEIPERFVGYKKTDWYKLRL